MAMAGGGIDIVYLGGAYLSRTKRNGAKQFQFCNYTALTLALPTNENSLKWLILLLVELVASRFL